MDAARLSALIDATWPAAARRETGGWVIREAKGAGSRASAATLAVPATPRDPAPAEEAMQALGQPRLFMVRPGEEALDAALAARGYAATDPTCVMAAQVAELASDRPPPVTSFEVWPPLAAQREIWAEGGIGPARLAVMQRACTPKVSVLGRASDRPAGTGFAAIHDGTAVLHALEVRPSARRRGLGAHMVRALAFWAAEHGAGEMALFVTEANAAARALYAGMGFAVAGGYRYRVHPGDR